MRSLPKDRLYRRCDPAQFTFATTADLAESELPRTDDPDSEIAIVGQERAEDAIRFGIGIRQQGYNIFALGPTGLGKHRMIRQILLEQAAKEPVPPDYCYVNNFADPQKPKVLCLPPGRATALRKDMDRLIEELRVAVPAAFEGEDYRLRKQLLDKELTVRHEQAFDSIRHRAEERGLTLLRTPVGLALSPVHNGEVLDPEEFERLPQEEKERIEADVSLLQNELQEVIQAVPRWQREIREKERTLGREVITHAVEHLLSEVHKRYEDLPQVLSFLDELKADMAEHVDEFMPGKDEERSEDSDSPDGALPEDGVLSEGSFRGIKVNVVTDHGSDKGAPVVYEDHPTHPNLIGRVEHLAQFGALMTDFNLIRPGALHRANGGYLILDARKVLEQPLAWEELKRALRSRKVKIESIEQAMSLVSTVQLEPEPIPLDLKVVLLGEPLLYYTLVDADPDFPALFKVAADFTEHVDRTPDNDQRYARLLGSVARRKGLLPLTPDAVARVIEHASRLEGDSGRLSTHLRSLIDLLCEADFFAQRTSQKAITKAAVEEAIAGQVYRLDRIRTLQLEEIRRGTLLIDVRGSVIGQVNGLTVAELGTLTFGRPVRITARVRLGHGEVIDIERDVDLGGPLHTKGVLILSGYLGQRYARDIPLALSASLVFEQSYGEVDGDSASVAELAALLSAIGDQPLLQSLAVTGSVNQLGQIQAIGGVNEKIEGFFDTCKAVGFTSSQGVIIPWANVRHLMLRYDVVEAVAEGKFHIYPVTDMDEVMSLLCDLPAGAVNQRVETRLLAFADRAKSFAGADKKEALS